MSLTVRRVRFIAADIEIVDLESIESQADAAAGDFRPWLEQTQRALAQALPVEVPCGSCNACCRSGYFIHVEPQEIEALRAIPEALLFPAPGLPAGHKLMGRSENGECPMLESGACSIYEHRPNTCRVYDCRVFAATGVMPTDAAQRDVVQRAKRWLFTTDQAGAADLVALRETARFVFNHRDLIDATIRPQTAAQLVIFVLRVFDTYRAATTNDTGRLVNECERAFNRSRLTR